MKANEAQPGTKFWVKQKNSLEYALAQTETEKQLQVAIIQKQKVRNFFGFLFRVGNQEKLLFVEQNEIIIAWK